MSKSCVTLMVLRLPLVVGLIALGLRVPFIISTCGLGRARAVSTAERAASTAFAAPRKAGLCSNIKASKSGKLSLVLSAIAKLPNAAKKQSKRAVIFLELCDVMCSLS